MKRKTALLCMMALMLAAVIALAVMGRKKDPPVVTVHLTGAQKYVEATGITRPEYTCTLKFPVSGTVAACLAQPGDWAEKGQGLVRLSAEDASDALARALYMEENVAEAEKNAGKLILRAAFSGQITNVSVVPGQTVFSGEEALKMSGGGQMAVCTLDEEKYESFLAVKEITVATQTGVSYPATFLESSALSGGLVQAVFLAKGAPFWPAGTEVCVSAVTESWEDVCFLPEEAVHDGMVLVAGEKETRQVRVNPLFCANGQWAVRGLTEGTKVVIR